MVGFYKLQKIILVWYDFAGRRRQRRRLQQRLWRIARRRRSDGRRGDVGGAVVGDGRRGGGRGGRRRRPTAATRARTGPTTNGFRRPGNVSFRHNDMCTPSPRHSRKENSVLFYNIQKINTCSHIFSRLRITTDMRCKFRKLRAILTASSPSKSKENTSAVDFNRRRKTPRVTNTIILYEVENSDDRLWSLWKGGFD